MCSRICLLLVALLSVLPAAAQDKVIIAHRGASGYVPEHTLEAYAMAHAMGATYIEPDLVLTKDKIFICLHDIHLEATTDVEQRFPDHKRDDGKWYPADFTLEEIKLLRVHERLNNRFPVGAAKFEVPTFEEMIQLVHGLNATTKRNAGIYPELKDPAWHRANGLPMEEAFLAIVTRYGYSGPDANIYVQCFEAEPLQRMRKELNSALPQVQLMGSEKKFAAMLTREGIAAIAAYANGIGPAKGTIEAHPELVTWAHEHKLVVHPYTFRADAVPAKYKTFEAEIKQFLDGFGVDGLFTDFPDKVAASISPPK